MGVLSDRMRRAFSLMICVAAAAVTAAAESPLLNFVPAGADFLVFADLGQLRSRTGFDKMLESCPAVRELLDDFEARYRVRLDHCSELLWAGDGKRLRGLLIRTDLPEARFRQGLRDGGTRFSLKKYGEREVLLVEAGSAIAQEQLRLGLCYLEQNSVLAAEERGLELFFAGLQPGHGSFRFSGAGWRSAAVGCVQPSGDAVAGGEAGRSGSRSLFPQCPPGNGRCPARRRRRLEPPGEG